MRYTLVHGQDQSSRNRKRVTQTKRVTVNSGSHRDSGSHCDFAKGSDPGGIKLSISTDVLF